MKPASEKSEPITNREKTQQFCFVYGFVMIMRNEKSEGVDRVVRYIYTPVLLILQHSDSKAEKNLNGSLKFCLGQIKKLSTDLVERFASH